MTHFQIAAGRTPVKQLWDAAALAKFCTRGDMTWQQKQAYLGFYFNAADHIQPLFVTLTRSGFHYSMLTIQLALDLADGGSGEYYYADRGWRLERGGLLYTHLDWRTPTHTTGFGIDGRHLYFTHQPFFRVRSGCVERMRAVLLVRNLLDQMSSWYFRLAEDRNDPFSFPWRKRLTDSIEYLNSWGDFRARHDNVAVCRYEDLTANPFDELKRLLAFWQLEVPDDCLRTALERTSKEEMRRRLPEAEQDVSKNSRVSFRGDGDQAPAALLDAVREAAKTELVHNFGYEY